MGKLSLTDNKPNLYFLTLVIFICSLPVSEFMVSVSAGLLFIVSILEDSWKNKINRAQQRKIILFIPAIFIIYLISAFVTKNGDTALYDLRKAMFFIIIPLSFLFGKSISAKQKQYLFGLFVLAVVISSIITIVKWQFSDSPENFSIHNAGLISHIRFSFQIILAIWFLVIFSIKNYKNLKPYLLVIMLFITVFLIGFLFLQQSLTGIVTFIISVIFFILTIIVTLKGVYRYLFTSLFGLICIIPFIYVGIIAAPFYWPEKVDVENMPQYTSSGNLYTHNFENKLIENGQFVYLYICEDELKEEWNNVSELKYDSLDQFGFQIKGTIKRYLTSKGLRKDAGGIKALSVNDIANIENGISNYIFKEKRFSLYPRVYQTVWEFYMYTRLGKVNDQSFSQRIEFSKAAITIIKDNLWMGVGSGNWKKAFFDAYKEMNSNLDEKHYSSSHNQYLNYLVKFGIVGFILIMFFLIYPVIKMKGYKDILFLVFLISMFVANFGDSNFETHMGSSFFVFFYCLFITNRPHYFNLKQTE